MDSDHHSSRAAGCVSGLCCRFSIRRWPPLDLPPPFLRRPIGCLAGFCMHVVATTEFSNISRDESQLERLALKVKYHPISTVELRCL